MLLIMSALCSAWSPVPRLTPGPARSYVDALKVAFRVLTAFRERKDPDPADVEALKSYAPLLADAPEDELACEVIHQALRRRAEVRAKSADV